jgi:alkylation response protein AidB-like acyl-CoA dehydrogenase
LELQFKLGGLGMGFVIDNVGLRLYFWSNRFILDCFAHQELELCQLLYTVRKNKTKYVPKLTSGEWFGAYCLREPGAGSDAKFGKNKTFYLKMENIIPSQAKNVSNAGFCSVFIVFCSYWR